MKSLETHLKVQSQRKYSAFTLIEMIGVLAVIAILAALLLPKVFEAINNARINNAAVSYNTVKTAIADHYAKFGSLLGTINPATGLPIAMDIGQKAFYDKTLVSEGFLDKPFEVKIGSTWLVQAVPGEAATEAVTGSNSAYNLDGGGVVNDAGPATATVIQAVITGVTSADAKDLNDRLDGTGLGAATGPDSLGRIKYGADAGGIVTVYMYLTHR